MHVNNKIFLCVLYIFIKCLEVSLFKIGKFFLIFEFIFLFFSLLTVSAFMLCYAQDDATSEGIRVSRISIIELLVGKEYARTRMRLLILLFANLII